MEVENMAKQKTSKKAIQEHEHELEVFALRKAGLGYQQIADKTGMSLGGAYGCVRRHLERMRSEACEMAAEIREMELERLDVIATSLWNKVVSGNEVSIDRYLKVMERRARMLGLDSANQTETTQDEKQFLMDLAARTGKPVEQVAAEYAAFKARDK